MINNRNAVNKHSRKERIIFFSLLFVIFSITILTQQAVGGNILIYITFATNGIVWVTLLLKEIRRHPFSINMMQWCFCLFFLFFAALVQYMNNSFSWAKNYSDDTIIITNLLLLLWTIVYCFGIKCAQYKVLNNKISDNSKSVWNGYHKSIPLLSVIAVLITIYRIRTVGLSNLFSLGTSSSTVFSDNSAINTLVGKILMYTMYFIVVFSFYEFKNRKNIIPLIINSICLLISYFPTAIPRNNVAGIYFGLLLLFSNKIKKNRVFILLFTLIFMIAFPFLNVFRLAAFNDVDIFRSLANTINNIPKAWIAADYDAYSLFCGTIDYVKIHGLTWGGQLLGVLLFWIPRSIWPSKPLGSGETVAKSLGWSYSNLSEPLPAEGYINFGILGVIVFAFIFGFIITRTDDYYWKNAEENVDTTHRFDSLYFFMVGYSTFFFRGSLLSSFAYLVACMVSWYVLTSTISFGDKKIKSKNGM